MTSTLETTDIFRGAFYLYMGGRLEDIRFAGNGKQIASFMFTGPDLAEHDRAYRDGHALVNPLQFREALNHLRDILFKHLRTSQSRETRYDRTRKDRPHQSHC
ncbi:MAG: hypothetical protein SWH68_10015 [Thermodesulfobacteriota bacterium]|nr:hypothetical protein [Thermodesulfobacteriota bacterium]